MEWSGPRGCHLVMTLLPTVMVVFVLLLILLLPAPYGATGAWGAWPWGGYRGDRGITSNTYYGNDYPPYDGPGRVFRIHNNCPGPIWVAALGQPVPTLASSNTWELQPGPDPLILNVAQVSMSGRLWARTGCVTSVSVPVCSNTTTVTCPRNSGQDYVFCASGPSAGGCKLSSQGFFVDDVCSYQCVYPASWATARLSYSFPTFKCATGDCNGQRVCSISGDSPATLFEWSFLSNGDDIYDVSAVDGYNVAMRVAPTGRYSARTGQLCDATGCIMDSGRCPPELQDIVPAGAGGSNVTTCMSICAAIYNRQQRAQHRRLQELYDARTSDGKMMRDLLCCSCGDSCGGCGCDSTLCTYGCSPYVSTYPASYQPRMCRVEQWPVATDGQTYINAFKTQCPGAYSWQFDDVAGLHYCTGASYDITFC